MERSDTPDQASNPGENQGPITTTDLLVAYAYCPRKAYLLRHTSDPGTPHRYPELLRQRQQVHRAQHLAMLHRAQGAVRFYGSASLVQGHTLLTDALLATNTLQASCDVLVRKNYPSALGDYSYEPTLVAASHTVTEDQELTLLFAGFVLGQVQGTLPSGGRIVLLSGRSVHRKLESDYPKLQRLLASLQASIAIDSGEPPPVILNSHCPVCPFRHACHAKAAQAEDLSLLNRITPKLRQRYRKRGIFTITQLSYQFRPRRSKKVPKRLGARHNLELQALAIRTQKTFILELPRLSPHSPGSLELFIDIEGIPDQQFYYLFGLLVCENGHCSYQGFWADTRQQEEDAWNRFLSALSACSYPTVPIYHYGSYESTAFAQLGSRYEADCSPLQARLVNVLSHISGKLYFPVYSNSLKEIGRWIGATWTARDASGLQALVWRYDWEITQDPEYQQQILRYNEEDCLALQQIVGRLSVLADSADAQPDVEFAHAPKPQATSVGSQIHNSLEAILRVAHLDYEQKKITLRQLLPDGAEAPKKPGAQRGHIGYGRLVPTARTVVQVPGYITCPNSPDLPLQISSKGVDQTIIDLIFTKSGCRKTIVRYVGPIGFCPQCRVSYRPPALAGLGIGSHQLFGRGMKAWVAYQRIALRLPYRIITQVIEEQFGESISTGTIIRFLEEFATYYGDTESRLLARLLESPFIHVDETQINVEGINHYAWVFTDGRRVVLRLTDTRETTLVSQLLADYQGVLVSDFYPGYDAIHCRQQKCWVHLIRDLNEDLWANPFDQEFEAFILEVKVLISSILERVQAGKHRGRFLARFRLQIDQFFRNMITGRNYTSDLVIKYQQRFQRYRESLFVFLEQDGLPWNNNTAERAFRCLAVQRNISKSFHQSGATTYLRLVAINQTCRFQDKSLLQFFLSGETDLDAFRATKRVRSTRVGKRSQARSGT